MWGYREVYYTSVQSEADEIFARLDESCYTIGVILDGPAFRQGDPSRGALCPMR